MKTIFNKKIIYVTRKIIPDEYIKEFIFHNINYRRYIWNLFVEEYKKCNEWKEFKPKKICSYIIETVDKPKKHDEYYCVDIPKSVNRDVIDAFKKVMKNSKKVHQLHSLHFKSFDRYRGAFRVRVCNQQSTISNKLIGKVHIKDSNTFTFRASRHNHFDITLKEPLYDYYNDGIYYTYNNDKELEYTFMDKDIKDIVFKHEMGQFYISLCIEVTYVINKKEYKLRNTVSGIDLGIRNPITIYDGENTYYIKMSNKEAKKIIYLEKRCKRLQSIMDRKMEINKKKQEQDENYNIYTKNYERVRCKFRRTHKRICDIKRNWRKKLACKLSKMYKYIVLDKFKLSNEYDNKNMPSKIKRYINSFNRRLGMSYFIEDLIHACKKNNCIVIDSPDKSTCTCSYCNHINPKLSLNNRLLKCEKCGLRIDRDINAAINCYNHYFSIKDSLV